MSAQYNRLYRSRDDRMVAGVASGLGEYSGIDPTLIRLAFTFSALIYPPSALAYLIMMVVVPEEPSEESIAEPGSGE